MSKPLRKPYKTSLPQPWQSSVLGLPTSTLPPGMVNLRLMRAPENLTRGLHRQSKTATACLSARFEPHSVCKILALRQPDTLRSP